MTISTITSDGKLTIDEVLLALESAIQETADSLTDVLIACNGDKVKIEAVIFQRDQVISAYFTVLGLSLLQTGALYENMAISLAEESKKLKADIDALDDVDDQIQLFTSIANLAASLTLAFA
jgi:hypothetical protein